MGTTLAHGVMRAIWTFAVAVPLLAGCGSADDEAEPSTSSSESPTEDTAADLEAGAPDGKYAAAYVLELVRESLIEVSQSQPFAPIYVRLLHGQPE